MQADVKVLRRKNEFKRLVEKQKRRLSYFASLYAIQKLEREKKLALLAQQIAAINTRITAIRNISSNLDPSNEVPALSRELLELDGQLLECREEERELKEEIERDFTGELLVMFQCYLVNSSELDLQPGGA